MNNDMCLAYKLGDIFDWIPNVETNNYWITTAIIRIRIRLYIK